MLLLSELHKIKKAIFHIFEIDEREHLLGSMVDILDPIIVRFIFPYSLFFL